MRRWVLWLVVLVLAGCSPAPSGDEGLRQVDDLPLYELRYTGDYDALAGVPEAAPPTPFGCSLFVAPGPLFARNFDWESHPALVLHTDPPDGYASVSMVDMHYLEDDLDRAPLLPFDGMNERGLFVGLAADESASLVPDPAKPTVGGVRVQRLVLDEAATVDEAIAVFVRYNLDFDGGPPLHYLVADATGAAAVIEYVDGRMRVVRDTRVLTNIRLSGVPRAARMTDERYAIAASSVPGVSDWSSAMGVLRSVAQPHTRWSAVYDPATATVRVVAGQKWQTVHTFTVGGR